MCLKVIKTVQFCKQKDKRNIIGETEIKQIMSENPTWKFEFYHATPNLWHFGVLCSLQTSIA